MLVLLASLYIVNNYLKFLYTKGICSSIFINRVIKVLIFVSISTLRYKFVCDGTNSRSGHVAVLTTTYVTDNNGALLLAKNPIFHERTKHIAVKYHYIRDLIDKGILDLIYVPTKEQKADGFTKALDKVKFAEFIRMLGMN
jgi:hypothetical protein